jgi:hypothetical protein
LRNPGQRRRGTPVKWGFLALTIPAHPALDDGILDTARQNARTSVTALLDGLGFHTVDVQ